MRHFAQFVRGKNNKIYSFKEWQMLMFLKLGDSTWEFIMLFISVVFGSFNNKNVKKYICIQKRFVTLIFKEKKVRFIVGVRDIRVIAMNTAITGVSVAESQKLAF